MIDLFALACASAFISFTISEAKIAEVVRVRVGGPLKCGYCLGFWVSAALVLTLRNPGWPMTFVEILQVAWLSGMMFFLACALAKIGGK